MAFQIDAYKNMLKTYPGTWVDEDRLCLKKWTIKSLEENDVDRTICIFVRNNEIFYRISSTKTFEGTLPIEQETLDEKIVKVRQKIHGFEIVREYDEASDTWFEIPTLMDRVEKWNMPNAELSLFVTQKCKFVWDFFEKTTGFILRRVDSSLNVERYEVGGVEEYLWEEIGDHDSKVFFDQMKSRRLAYGERIRREVVDELCTDLQVGGPRNEEEDDLTGAEKVERRMLTKAISECQSFFSKYTIAKIEIRRFIFEQNGAIVWYNQNEEWHKQKEGEKLLTTSHAALKALKKLSLSQSSKTSSPIDEVAHGSFYKGAPFKIVVRPDLIHSKIDDRTEISTFVWGITITSVKKHPLHAQLVIEGCEGGYEEGKKTLKHRIILADLGGDDDNFIRIKDLLPGALKFDARSPIWKCSAEKVKRMLTDIERDKLLLTDPKKDFFRLGLGSIFNRNKKHNCTSWAKEKIDKYCHSSSIYFPFRYKDLYLYISAMDFTKPKDYYKEKDVHESCMFPNII